MTKTVLFLLNVSTRKSFIIFHFTNKELLCNFEEVTDVMKVFSWRLSLIVWKTRLQILLCSLWSCTNHETTGRNECTLCWDVFGLCNEFKQKKYTSYYGNIVKPFFSYSKILYLPTTPSFNSWSKGMLWGEKTWLLLTTISHLLFLNAFHNAW